MSGARRSVQLVLSAFLSSASYQYSRTVHERVIFGWTVHVSQAQANASIRNITEPADRIDRINEAVAVGVAKLHASYAQRNKGLKGVRDFKAGSLVWKHRVQLHKRRVLCVSRSPHRCARLSP